MIHDLLSHEIRQQRHKARTFDRGCEFALVPHTNAGTLARNNFSKRGKVSAQRVRILIIDGLRVDLAEMTLMRNLFLHKVKMEYLPNEFLVHQYLDQARRMRHSVSLLEMSRWAKTEGRLLESPMARAEHRHDPT